MITSTATLGELSKPKQWPILNKSAMVESGYPVYGANGPIGFSKTFTHERPTLLVACRGTCGAVHVTQGPTYANGNAMALDRLDESQVDLHYLARYLRYRGLRDVTTGSSQPQITRENLVRVKVPLPPLPEQRRIAAILDQAGELRAKRRRALAFLDELADALFADMFGHVHEQDSVGLLELCTAQSGGTPSKQVAEFWGEDIPWFSPKDMKAPDLWDSLDHVAGTVISKAMLRLLPANTVVMVVRGMILAHSFPVACIRVPSTINQDMKALIPRANTDPQFLAHAIRAQTRDVLSLVSTSGHGTKRLDVDSLASIRVPLVPFPAQSRFGQRVLRLQQVKAGHQDHLSHLDELFASLQHRAFEGQL